MLLKTILALSLIIKEGKSRMDMIMTALHTGLLVIYRLKNCATKRAKKVSL